MSKYLDETVRLQSEKRQEWIREIRGERLQGIAEGASSAPRLASSSAVSFPGRNECLMTHCSLIEQEEKRTVPARSATEFEITRKVEERTGWRGQSESQTGEEEKKNGRLYGVAETSKGRAEWRRLQQKNWACQKGKSGLSATERAVGKNAGAALAKRKRNKAVCPEYQVMRGERVKVGKSRTLARVRGIRVRAWRGKGGLDCEGRQIPRRTGRASNKSLPRTSRRKHEQVSGCKSSPGRCAESWFHS